MYVCTNSFKDPLQLYCVFLKYIEPNLVDSNYVPNTTNIHTYIYTHPRVFSRTSKDETNSRAEAHPLTIAQVGYMTYDKRLLK